MRLFTIGHSTRALDAFLGLLDRERIARVADVRRFAASRRHPQYAGPALGASLAAHGLSYRHWPDLGGRRRPVPDSPNGGWHNEGFRGYADYMQTAEFGAALDRLIADAATGPTAIMCAEAVPWRCHRWLIADALVARGHDVLHILDARTESHHMTGFAVLDGPHVIYPATAGPA